MYTENYSPGHAWRSTSRWVRHACAVHDGSYNACLRVEAEDVRACLSRCVEGGAMEVNPALRDDAGDVVLARTTGEVIAPAQIVSLPGVVEGDAEQGGAGQGGAALFGARDGR